MKFNQMIYDTGAHIPHLALSLAMLTDEECLEMFVKDGALVLTKSKMTAMDIIKTIEQIEEISIGLSIMLAESCGPCSDCEDGCPYPDPEEPDIELPGYLLEEAGIPCDAKLIATADEETETVMIYPAPYKHDLRDVPSWILTMLEDNGACLGKLEEYLHTDEVIYDG